MIAITNQPLLANAPLHASTPTPLHLLGARDIASQVASGALRAIDLVAYLFARISALGPHLHAMVDIDAAGAMTQATHADRLAKAGQHLPLPFTVKDNLWVGGRSATYGSALFAGHIVLRDSIAQRCWKCWRTTTRAIRVNPAQMKNLVRKRAQVGEVRSVATGCGRDDR